MKIDEALILWGYENNKRRAKQLKSFCMNHPEVCSSLEPISIRRKAVKPYLLDKGNKDIYSHIIYAIRRSAHLYPDSIGIDDDHLKQCIDQLCKARLIKKIPKKKKYNTENYTETPSTDLWLRKRKAARIETITKAFSPLKPDSIVAINNNLISPM